MPLQFTASIYRLIVIETCGYPFWESRLPVFFSRLTPRIGRVWWYSTIESYRYSRGFDGIFSRQCCQR